MTTLTFGKSAWAKNYYTADRVAHVYRAVSDSTGESWNERLCDASAVRIVFWVHAQKRCKKCMQKQRTDREGGR